MKSLVGTSMRGASGREQQQTLTIDGPQFAVVSTLPRINVYSTGIFNLTVNCFNLNRYRHFSVITYYISIR